ncbi:hypothetical protein VP01_2886g2 [Puccinia sorghi]|uniref:Uncharacterized protein n=1 Tax=Puccinia sorghi TaxID=27349 RepID=A0A0L6V1P8_9BASI|nr:hypothetical protein VP01_2886g2 [Puccinia sorghi]
MVGVTTEASCEFLHVNCKQLRRFFFAVVISSLLSITKLKKIYFLSQKYIKSPTPGIIHPCISSNPKLEKYFDQCLGALDGPLTKIEKLPIGKIFSFFFFLIQQSNLKTDQSLIKARE